MERFIEQKFIGKIGEVEIEREDIYEALDFLLGKIEEKFGDCYNEAFVGAINEKFMFAHDHANTWLIEDVINDVNSAISAAETFETIAFSDTFGFESLNRLMGAIFVK